MKTKALSSNHALANICIAVFCLSNVYADDFSNLKLRYDEPAVIWTDALPIGNGRLGAMVYGGIEKEMIQFNEDTLWTGKPHDYSHEGAAEYLPQIRKLLFEGKQKEAEELAMDNFMSVPLHQCAYQAFGNILLNFPSHKKVTEYKRSLDLDTAVATTSYRAGGVLYTRQVLSSLSSQVIAVRISADKAKALNFTVSMDTPHPQSTVVAKDDSLLVLSGRLTGEKFESHLLAETEDGKIISEGNLLKIENASSVILKLAAATSFKNFNDISGDPAEICTKTIKAAESITWEKIRSQNIADHRKLFRRVSLDMGTTDAAKLATDERIANFATGDDPQFVSLLFQYGRYLLISSSRPGTQPANLQGIWTVIPAWGSKYTTNINTEMNYWLAELTNLSECHDPLFDMLEDLSITGAKVAKAHYDCRGWVLHHNTDLWRGAAPINKSNHGIWPTGGAWLCQHLYQRYQFTLDKDFLKKRAYPIMKESAQFFLDFLIEDPKTGYLISTPSNSPENGGLVAGPTMDHQIISELFQDTIEAAEILKTDKKFRQQLKETLKRIAPMQIGQHGQLQEWLEDKDSPNNHHRHVSHLWGLHPGRQITRYDTPELFEAAKQSLLFRGDEATGWSMAWKVNFWARFYDGDHAYKIMTTLLRPARDRGSKGGQRSGLYKNMFDAHPPFCVDGNFGVTAGIVEMLLQSHTGVIELLPALPSNWPKGNVKGICARGAFEVDIQWQGGKLVNAEILSKKGSDFLLRTKTAVNITSGGKKIKTASPDEGVIQFKTKRGKTYQLSPG